ncbi:MAG: hypothetical protein AABX51_06335 [Nanoarchaeota archaeon]
MAESLDSLARREFLKFGAGAALLASMPRAAYGTESQLSDIKWNFTVTVETDYARHTHGGARGIDFHAGSGAPTAAPIEGWVYQAGAAQSVPIFYQSDLGHMIEVAGQDELYVQAGQRVTPFILTGPEGLGAPRVEGSRRMGVSHIHFGIALPPFAKEFGKGTDPYTHPEGRTFLWEDPDRHSFAALQGRGGIMDSLYQGDHSHQKKLLEEAVRRFESIADRHPDSFLAKYIRWSREENIMFFPRPLAAYQLWKDGFLEKDVAETLKEYLHWHSNINIGLFLPYPNPALKEKYIKPAPDPGRIQRLRELKDRIQGHTKNRNDAEALELLKEFDKEAPIGIFGDFGAGQWNELKVGRLYGRLGQSEKAVTHSLTAYGLLYLTTSKYRQSYERRLYRPLEVSFRRLGMPQLSEYFGKKSLEIK